jgi:hypothetical protein
MLYRLVGSPSAEGLENPFKDLEAEWYTDAVVYLSSIGVIMGITEDTFGPNRNITREQMVAMLYRLSGEKFEGEVNFDDFEDGSIIYPYAVEAMAWAVEKGLINGVVTYAKEGVYLEPQGLATRAQATKVILLFASL